MNDLEIQGMRDYLSKILVPTAFEEDVEHLLDHIKAQAALTKDQDTRIDELERENAKLRGFITEAVDRVTSEQRDRAATAEAGLITTSPTETEAESINSDEADVADPNDFRMNWAEGARLNKEFEDLDKTEVEDD